MRDEDTIFAPAAGAARAAIAVVRISGSRAGASVRALTGSLPAPRRASYRAIRDPGDGRLLDRGLVLWLPGPASFTGEDQGELQVHGGRAVVEAILSALAALPGLRPAEPGEFSRRAFLNGRLDLAQLEGIADLVNAETEAQRRQALAQADGALSRLHEGWAARLTRLLAHLEAALDFADEDLPEEILAEADAARKALIAELAEHLADRRGERLREGVRIAILGAPNAGKSSLLNALARREAAIVTDRAGTTRDVIEVGLDLGGVPVILSDTAGLRATDDAIEAEGVRRAEATAARADLRLCLFDAGSPPDAATLAWLSDDALVVASRADLVSAPPGVIAGRQALALSVTTGDGLAALTAAVTRQAAALTGGPAPALTRLRHRQALEETVAALERAGTAGLPELIAEDVRLALRALGRITGRVDVEDLLEVIFRDFCIGK